MTITDAASLLDSLSNDEDRTRLRRFGYEEAWALGTWSVERGEHALAVEGLEILAASQRGTDGD